MLRPLAVLLLSLLVVAAPLRASDTSPVEVRPGAVATMIVSLPARSVAAAQASARFTIQPAEGVRILGATSGVLSWNGKSERRLPIALTVAAHATAGAMSAGWVRIDWADGQSAQVDLSVRVGVVRKLVLEAVSSRPTVKPGESVRITYRVANHGNSADTVHVEALAGTSWKVAPASESRVLPAGGLITGHFEVTAPRSAPLGEHRLVQVRAVGRGGEEKAGLSLIVAEDETNPLGLAQIPGSVFFGGSSSGGYNVAVSARGLVGSETEVGVAYRHLGFHRGQALGQKDLWGPRALLTLRHRGLRAELGEVSLRTDGMMSGTYAAGYGVQAQLEKGDLSGGFFAARPVSRAREPGGLLLHGDIGYALPLGTLSARVFDLDMGSSWGARANRLQSAGLRYSIENGGPHRLQAEAGISREVSPSGADTRGLAVDASYSYGTPAASFSAQVRRLPAALSGSARSVEEAQVNGSLRLADVARVSASAFWSERAGLQGQRGTEGRGVSAGVTVSGLGSTFGVSVNRREHEGAFVIGGSEIRTTISGSVSTGMGPVSLRTSAEIGEAVLGTSDVRDVRRMQGQLRWSRLSKSAWVGISYADEHLYRSPAQAEVGTELRLGELNLNAAAGANLAGAGVRGTYLRAGIEAHVTPTTSLVAGVEHTSTMLSLNPAPWTFSLGVRKALPLPLPMKAIPKVSGVVFDDRNGDGKQDRGEPGLSGVGLSIGSMRATTDARGRFVFRSAVPTGLPVRMDVGTLGEGVMALFSETLVSNRRIEMPVVRAAALTLTLFEDANGDEVMDGTETALPGIAVEVRSAIGRTYPGITGAKGRLSFSALPPGEYTATVLRKDQDPVTIGFRIDPGESASRGVGVRPLTRQIKWGGSATDPR